MDPVGLGIGGVLPLEYDNIMNARNVLQVICNYEQVNLSCTSDFILLYILYLIHFEAHYHSSLW